MIKISHCSYSLSPLRTLNTLSVAKDREGALLKVEWEDGLIGYADLHPWPELGDAPLEQQLTDLKKGLLSPQLEQSLQMSHRDALLRQKTQHIFSDGVPLKNNFIISDIKNFAAETLTELKELGFATVKLKVGSSPAAEAKVLEQIAEAGLLIRLDFNATGTWEQFRAYIKLLSDKVLSKIEYVEDPFPFDLALWREVRQLLPIALDNEYFQVPWSQLSEAPCDVLVVKPAKINIQEALAYCQKWNLSLTVTSYMDHPVGVMHALGIAMELKKNDPELILEAGCLTHTLYKENSFSAAMPVQGPYILQNPGTGVGFDDLLEALPWSPLACL